MKKRIIAAVLSAASLTTLFSFSAYAKDEAELRYETLYSEDFEGMTVGENPPDDGPIKKANDDWVDTLSTHPWTKDFPVISDKGKDNSKGLQLSCANSVYRVRMNFTLNDTNLADLNVPYTVTEGAFVVEFDAYQGLGGLSVGLGAATTNAVFWKPLLVVPIDGNDENNIYTFTKQCLQNPITATSYGKTAYTDETGEAIQLPMPDDETAYLPYLHYKIIVDVENQSLAIEITDDKGNITRSVPVEGIEWLEYGNKDAGWTDTNSVIFRATRTLDAQSKDMPTVIDNIDVYTLKPRAVKAEFTDYSNVTVSSEDIVSASTETIGIKFDRPMDLSSVQANVVLTNLTTGKTEEMDSFTISDDKKTVYAKPAKRYLDPNSKYKIDVDANTFSASGTELGKGYSFKFETAGGGFYVLGTKLYNGKTEIKNISDVKAGDKVTMKVQVVNTDTSGTKRKLALAFTATENNTMNYIQRQIEEVDKLGGIVIEKDFTLDNPLSFDRLDALVWNLNTFSPFADSLTIK